MATWRDRTLLAGGWSSSRRLGSRVVRYGGLLLTAGVLLVLTACTSSSPKPGPTRHSASLLLKITDLPAGAAASVRVTGPGGYRHSVFAGQTLTGLAPGRYHVTAGNVASKGLILVPTVAGAWRKLHAGGSAVTTVAY